MSEDMFTVNGKTYKAVPSEGCEGCALLEEQEFCWGEKWRNLPKCTEFGREDNIEVIWVEVKP